MTLVERLEKFAKSCDPWVHGNYLHQDRYDIKTSDVRELLEEAANRIKQLEREAGYV